MELESILFGSDSDHQETNGLSATGTITKTNSLYEWISPKVKLVVEELKNETSSVVYPNKFDDDD